MDQETVVAPEKRTFTGITGSSTDRGGESDPESDQAGHGFMLTQGEIDEFKALVAATCNTTLSNLDAWNRATELLGFLRMLMGPIPEDPEVVSGVRASSDLPSSGPSR